MITAITVTEHLIIILQTIPLRSIIFLLYFRGQTKDKSIELEDDVMNNAGFPEYSHKFDK